MTNLLNRLADRRCYHCRNFVAGTIAGAGHCRFNPPTVMPQLTEKPSTKTERAFVVRNDAGDVDCNVDIHGGTDKFFFIALQNAQSYFLQVADASLNGRRFPYGLTCEFKCLAVRLEEMQGYGENAGNNYQRHPVAMTHIHTIFPDLERYVPGSCHVKHLAG